MIDLRSAAQAEQPAIDADPRMAQQAQVTWGARMANEYHSAPVFLGLAEQFKQAGAAPSWAAEAQAMAREERRHGVLCGAVVEALGGQAIMPDRDPDPLPAHADVDPMEAVTRNLLSVGCMSETVAVALISAERLRAADSLRPILTEILADEIGHARLGWRWLARYMPTTDSKTKARLNAYLRVAFAHLETHELAHLPVGLTPLGQDRAAAEALGLCSGEDSRALFYATVEQAIIPRLEANGLAARSAWSARHTA